MKTAKTSSTKPKGKKSKGMAKINKVVLDDKFKFVSPKVDLRGVTQEDIKAVLDDRANRMANYITAVLEPEYAVTEGLIAKQPSLFPIPSTSVCFRDNLTIRTDGEGDFAIAWNPNMLFNKEALERYKFLHADGTDQFVCDSICRLVQKEVNHGYLLAYPSYVPDVSLAKYRLVSAKLKVTYVGSVLNKSGMMYACATYDQTPVFVGVSNTDTEDPLIPVAAERSFIDWRDHPDTIPGITYRNLTETAISNGIWNKNVNITNSSQGLSCLHLPTDPINEVFYPIGTYFGGSLSTNSWHGGSSFQRGDAIGESFTSNSGAQLCYMVCGHGLPEDQECINIQIFYTFETIPTTSSAPFLRGVTDKTTTKEREVARNVVREVAPQIAITTKRPGSSLWNGIRNMVRDINWGDVFASTAKLVPRILKFF